MVARGWFFVIDKRFTRFKSSFREIILCSIKLNQNGYIVYLKCYDRARPEGVHPSYRWQATVYDGSPLPVVTFYFSSHSEAAKWMKKRSYL